MPKADRVRLYKERYGETACSYGEPGITELFPPRWRRPANHNGILLALPRHEREKVLPKLELVRLQPHLVLHEVGEYLAVCLFLQSWHDLYILSVFPDGKSVEVGLVGREGFVGLPLVAGFRSAATRAVTQIEDTAFRLSADSLPGVLRECATLERKLQQFSQVMAMQATQIAERPQDRSWHRQV